MPRKLHGEIVETTLLELVNEFSKITRTDAETVAAVRCLLETRRVRLIGNFRGRRLEDDPPSIAD